MSQAIQKANNYLTERIISFLHGLDYTGNEFKEDICLPLAQWLYEEGFSIEDTGVIVTSVANISNDALEDIYNHDTVNLMDKSDLMNLLSQEEYERLEQLINPPKRKDAIIMPIDEDSHVKVDFLNKTVSYIKEGFNNKGEPAPIEKRVIEAVPSELIVYDSDFSESVRTFKITWKSKYSQRAFITQSENGATISEIEKQLLDGAYSHSKKLLSNVLSAMVNAMIRDNLAIVKDDIDTKGVYYHDGKVLIVKLDTRKPSVDEIKSALMVLQKLHDNYSESETTILATVLKWCLTSVFSFARKQAGSNWLPWLYLEGAGQSGKTTISKIGSFFYDEPNDAMNIGGGSFNSDYRIGRAISRDCCLTIVNEPKATFNNENTTETVKNSVELKVCREVHSKTYYAFSPVIFTANGFVPEMDSLYRRLFIINFEYNQRKSKEDSEKFEEMFNVENPSRSCLKELEVLGRVALRTVMNNTDLLFEDWMTLADYLMNQCYVQAGYEKMPDWLSAWSEDKELSDLDNDLIEYIQAIIGDELYKARKHHNTYSDYSDGKSRTSKEFEAVYWNLLNEGAFNWAIPHHPWGKGKNIFLTQGFKKLLKNNGLEEMGSLKSIGQLLGWKHKTVKFGETTKRGLLVPFEEFIRFAIPSVEQ